MFSTYLSDPEATAQIFAHSLVHHLIVQKMLHGKDIMPIERDRLVENLVKSDHCELRKNPFLCSSKVNTKISLILYFLLCDLEGQ